MLNAVGSDGRREVGTQQVGEPAGGRPVPAHPPARVVCPAGVEGEEPVEQAGVADALPSLFGAGKHGRPEDDDGCDEFGPAHGQPQGDQRAEGVTSDDHGALDTQFDKGAGHRVGVIVGSVIGVRVGGGAEAEQVGDDETAAVGEPVERLAPVAARAGQPMEQHERRCARAERADGQRAVGHGASSRCPHDSRSAEHGHRGSSSLSRPALRAKRTRSAREERFSFWWRWARWVSTVRTDT